jgi:hypothetical protein
MPKVTFNKKETLLTSKLNLNWRNKVINFYVYCIAFYGSETGTLRRVDQKYLGSFEVWC